MAECASLCALCGARQGERGVKKLRACSGCMLAYYCGPQCQKKHWKEHRAACRFAVAEAAEGEKAAEAAESAPSDSEEKAPVELDMFRRGQSVIVLADGRRGKVIASDFDEVKLQRSYPTAIAADAGKANDAVRVTVEVPVLHGSTTQKQKQKKKNKNKNKQNREVAFEGVERLVVHPSRLARPCNQDGCSEVGAFACGGCGVRIYCSRKCCKVRLHPERLPTITLQQEFLCYFFHLTPLLFPSFLPSFLPFHSFLPFPSSRRTGPPTRPCARSP